MNSVVRHIAIDRQVSRSRSPRRFSRRHAPVDRRRQRHHGRARQGYFRDDGDLGVVVVGRSADADRQHQPGSFVLAAAQALRLLRRQHPDVGSDRHRRALCRQGRAQGRRALCRRRMDDARFRRAAAGRRAGGDRLRGRGNRRAAFPCHRDRPRAGPAALDAHRGAGLLAGPICRDRSGRGCGEAGRGQPSGAARGAKPDRPPFQASLPGSAVFRDA